jgi:hypothetical protein
MKLSVLAGASAIVLALSTAGFAAGPTAPMKMTLKPAARCASLETQFDTAWPAHKAGKHAASAEKLRAEGGKLCGARHYAAGERKIVSALKIIGVKASI